MNRAFLFGVTYQAYALWSATGTGAGYDPINVTTPNQYETWKTFTGGTLSITSGASSGFGGGAETRAIGIISPAGDGMIGDITVRVKNMANTLLATFVVPRYSPAGFADRRFIFIEDETWRNDTYKIEIDCAAASEISRVIRLSGPASLSGFQSQGHCADLADALAGDWTVRPETVASTGESSGSDFFWPTNETIPRYKLFQGVLQAFKEGVQFNFRKFYDNRGFMPEVVIVPFVFQHDDDEKQIKLMHMNSVFGRLTGTYQLQHAGIDEDDGETLYNMPFQIEELI